MQSTEKRETGFTIPPPRQNGQSQEMQEMNGGGTAGGGGGETLPYHATVLPVRASPKETGGFGDDAFKPLWRKEAEGGWNGFGQERR